MKVKIEGHIQLVSYSWKKEPHYDFCSSGFENEERVNVIPHTIEIDVPDRFDPKPALVKVLQEKQRKLRAEAEREISLLDERIQNLLCLENKAEDGHA
jgi:hypothetical protein